MELQELMIRQFVTPLNETNMYFAVDQNTKHAILIDPSDEKIACKAILEEGLHLDYILLTHEHYDHISALEEIKSQYQVKTVASWQCSERIQNPRQNMSRYFNVVLDFKAEEDAAKKGRQNENAGSENREPVLPYYAGPADITFNGSVILNWHGHLIRLQEAPGHSPGGVLIDIDGNCLFSGDSLSCDYRVVTGFPGGSKKQYQQITKPLLDSFDQDTQVHPGHGRSFLLREIQDLQNFI